MQICVAAQVEILLLSSDEYHFVYFIRHSSYPVIVYELQAYSVRAWILSPITGTTLSARRFHVQNDMNK